MAKQQEDDVARYEQELADYLQERLKPNLNSGTIPLVARSIAKEIAHREHPLGAPNGAKAEDGDGAKAEDGDSAKAENGDSAKAENGDSAESPDFEADMHELQSELGEDWIVSFSVHGDDAWLTAHKDDGSQRVEAQTAAVLSQAVELLNAGGGRSS